ncbi:HAD-IB family hydrolase [Candidatus Poribacteria bacterium]|nr:HAD-IB family hydrolase [Candidatus Poribacteria bacterium]
MRKAAIFDLDGTILNISSERTFFFYLFLRGDISLKDFTIWLGYCVKKAYRDNFTAAIKSNKMYLRNKSYKRLYELASRCFTEKLSDHISDEAVKEIEYHRSKGHYLILLSGTLNLLLKHFMDYLKMDLMIGTSVETQNNTFTGRLNGVHPFGESKALIAKKIAQEYEINLEESYGYGNSFSDVPFLNTVGHAIAVNPDNRLTRYARQNNWRIMNFV